jgi:thiol-disulfide isomerase/thioredoxin
VWPLVLGVAAACGGGSGQGTRATPASATRAADSPASFAAAVDFSFDSLDARPLSAELTRGLPTLIAFVTTESLPCQAQVDFLLAMARHDADRVHYAVVAVERPENRELVEMYQKALAIPFPVAMADAETLAGSGPFGDVRGIPVTVLLDRAGRVVWRAGGRVAKSEEMREAMRGL